ncbi:hypothetical protein CBL_07929 [Carabus blaptoides fortunei]
MHAVLARPNVSTDGALLLEENNAKAHHQSLENWFRTWKSLKLTLGQPDWSRRVYTSCPHSRTGCGDASGSDDVIILLSLVKQQCLVHTQYAPALIQGLRVDVSGSVRVCNSQRLLHSVKGVGTKHSVLETPWTGADADRNSSTPRSDFTSGLNYRQFGLYVVTVVSLRFVCENDVSREFRERTDERANTSRQARLLVLSFETEVGCTEPEITNGDKTSRPKAMEGRVRTSRNRVASASLSGLVRWSVETGWLISTVSADANCVCVCENRRETLHGMRIFWTYVQY